jgi:fucose permease
MATGSGMVIGIGEIFGGGLAPALAGYIAKNFGIQHAVTMPLWALTIGVVVILALKETAPARQR